MDKNSRNVIGAMVIAIAAMLLIAGALGGDDTSSASTYHAPPAEATEFEITADMVVDMLSDRELSEFCGAWNLVGDYDTGLAAFSSTYGTSAEPSATEVFEELITRC